MKSPKSSQKKTAPEVKPEVDSKSEITRLFLNDDADTEQEISHVYNLPGEFSRSRANKSWPVYIAVASFTVILAASTFRLTQGIQQDIDRIDVGISDFRDLNLVELLNALKKAERELGSITEKIDMAKNTMEAEIAEIRRDGSSKLRLVNQSNISEAEKERRRSQINDETDRLIASTRRNYETSIREDEKRAQDARNRMDELKRKSEAEKAELGKTASSGADSGVDPALLLGGDTSTELKDLETKVADKQREYDDLMKKYDTDIESARSESEAQLQKTRDAEKLLDQYKRALTYFARTRGEHGYVIDPDVQGGILLDVNPFITIRRGDQAYVLNREDKIVALVELDPAGGRITARVLRRMVSGDIHPFDKILLIKK